ncbi:MAG: hypothetical protein KR126chlam5_00918 [Candidatus Anoxychlamydiales bacterium]|nr:hypothetical protein [Candidatus Anoxychlamydiales bacterium]
MESKKRHIKRLLPLPKNSFFLFGPRGSGKSTWVKKNYPNSSCIDLLIPNILRTYSGNPEHLISYVHGLKGIKTIIIDEIQKIPELLSVIHFLIEEKKGFQFILTGSSARKLKRAGVDLLAGRAIKKSMHPFLASELQNLFQLDHALKYGMLPLIWASDDQQEVLDSYVDLYILEEVQFEGLVRNLGNFSRFLSIIAFSHGSILNLSNIARECEVKRSMVDNFISILQDLLIATTIPIFTKRAKRMLISHSKFYLFDVGIFKAMRKTGILDSNSEIDGSALEGLVFQHLKTWCEYTKEKNALFFWRTKSGVEVDFIVYGKSGFWAIEVKNNTKVSFKDLKGLIHFSEDYPECTPILLYRGNQRLKIKGILCMPCDEFLKQIIPDQSLF